MKRKMSNNPAPASSSNASFTAAGSCPNSKRQKTIDENFNLTKRGQVNFDGGGKLPLAGSSSCESQVSSSPAKPRSPPHPLGQKSFNRINIHNNKRQQEQVDPNSPDSSQKWAGGRGLRAGSTCRGRRLYTDKPNDRVVLREPCVEGEGSSPTNVLRVLPPVFGPDKWWPTLVQRQGLGQLSNLPPGVLFVAFDQFDAECFVYLGRASKVLCSLILDYVFSTRGLRRFQARILQPGPARLCPQHQIVHAHSPTPANMYKYWGRVLKAITCILPTSERIAQLERLAKAQVSLTSVVRVCVNGTGTEDALPENMHKLLAVQGWGNLITAFAELWDFPELFKLWRRLVDFNGRYLHRLMHDAVRSAPDMNVMRELQCRDWLMTGLVQQHFKDERDRSLWVSSLLKHLNLANPRKQAQLMMVLCAPTKVEDGNRVGIDWRTLCDDVVQDRAQAAHKLNRFVCIFNALLNPAVSPPAMDNETNSGHFPVQLQWTHEQVYALLEQTTTFPEPWALDNFAMLLLMNKKLAVLSIGLRMRTDNQTRVVEAASIMNAVKTMAYRLRVRAPPQQQMQTVAGQTAYPWAQLVTDLALHLTLQQTRTLYRHLQSQHSLQLQELFDAQPYNHDACEEEVRSYVWAMQLATTAWTQALQPNQQH